MLAVVLGVVFALALVWIALAYSAMRNEAHMASLRFAAMTKRTRALSNAVDAMNSNMASSFDSTDAGVASSAKRTMGVLGDAIRRETKVIEASAGTNRKAIAALGALLDANTKSLAQLMTSIGSEDKKALAAIMAKMEARHAEIVSYLSGGGIDAVADALATAAVGTEAFSVEHFSAFNMRVALSRFGVSLDDAELAKLDADLKSDVAAGLTLREAMFARLSKIQPVLTGARAKAEANLASAMTPVVEAIKSMDDAHRESVLKAMADQFSLVQTKLSDLTARVAASDTVQAAIAQTIKKVADAQAALAGLTAQPAPATVPGLTPDPTPIPSAPAQGVTAGPVTSGG